MTWRWCVVLSQLRCWRGNFADVSRHDWIMASSTFIPQSKMTPTINTLVEFRTHHLRFTNLSSHHYAKWNSLIVCLHTYIYRLVGSWIYRLNTLCKIKYIYIIWCCVLFFCQINEVSIYFLIFFNEFCFLIYDVWSE